MKLGISGLDAMGESAAGVAGGTNAGIASNLLGGKAAGPTGRFKLLIASSNELNCSIKPLL